MTLPSNPDQPTQDDPVIAEPAIEPVPATEPAPLDTFEPASEQPDKSEQGAAGKAKSVALFAGAAALANKVRQEAPKKVQEIRRKRAVGRCVILTEVNGRRVAIGPYRDKEAAGEDTVKVVGVPHVVELLPQSAYFESDEGESSASS